MDSDGDDGQDDLPKLVRDGIPDKIRRNGEKPVAEELDDEEAEPWLREKVFEEAQEFAESGELEELADLMEVVDRYREVEDISEEELYEQRERKNGERGSFSDNILLEDVEEY